MPEIAAPVNPAIGYYRCVDALRGKPVTAAARDVSEKYARWEANAAVAGRWDESSPGTAQNVEERNAAILRHLRQAGLQSLAGKRVLEIGCGSGAVLDLLRAVGARKTDLYGVDVRPGIIAEAKVLYPAMNFSVQEGARLDFPDASFDLVMIINALSSMTWPQDRAAVGREAMRVLRAEGALLWYDLRMPNFTNREVRPIRRREVERIFPGMRGRFESLTLVPPLARLLGRTAPACIRLLRALPFLRSHWMVLLRRTR